MADDPREAQIRALINGRYYPSEHEGAPAMARAWAEKAVTTVHRSDPLRALLTNEGQALDVIVSAMASVPESGQPRAVLAALREVAGL